MVPSSTAIRTGKLTVSALRIFALHSLGGGVAPLPWPTGTSQAEPVSVVVHAGADHPAFAGHFPGHPVLPGVVLLSLVMQALAEAPALQALLGPSPGISQAKFLAPVTPQLAAQALHIQLQAQGSGVGFVVADGPAASAQVFAKGQLSAAAVAGPASA